MLRLSRGLGHGEKSEGRFDHFWINSILFRLDRLVSGDRQNNSSQVVSSTIERSGSRKIKHYYLFGWSGRGLPPAGTDNIACLEVGAI